MPPYVVFGDATLQQMSHFIPQNLNSLSRISGVGAVKLEQYGDDFLGVICEHARENGLEDRTVQVARNGDRARSGNQRAGITSTAEKTKLLLESGYTVDQAAIERGLTANTIVAHMEMLVERGQLPNISDFLPEELRIERIKDAFQRVGYTRLAPVKELLGDEFSYEEIRLVRAYVRQQGATPID